MRGEKKLDYFFLRAFCTIFVAVNIVSKLNEGICNF